MTSPHISLNSSEIALSIDNINAGRTELSTAKQIAQH
jgi:hypothetical protein